MHRYFYFYLITLIQCGLEFVSRFNSQTIFFYNRTQPIWGTELTPDQMYWYLIYNINNPILIAINTQPIICMVVQLSEPRESVKI